MTDVTATVDDVAGIRTMDLLRDVDRPGRTRPGPEGGTMPSKHLREALMARLQRKRFTEPVDVRRFPNGRVDILELDDIVVGRMT